MLIQLLRKKLTFQQLLTSSIPLCDESQKFHRARKLQVRKRDFFFYCDERGVGRVRHGEANKIKWNEGFDTMEC